MEVLRHSSALGSWEFAMRPPSAALRGAVTRLCGYVEETTGFTTRIELPANEVTLIIGMGPPLEVSYPAHGLGPRKVGSFVSGLHSSHALVTSSGRQAGFEVCLTPFGARALLGIPMHELAHRDVPLDDVLGPAASLLAERLDAAAGWAAKLDLLEAELARRIRDAARPTPSIVWSWQRLHETGGAVRVDALASELGCSRRHLVAGFRDEVGLTPKVVGRVARFQRALRLVEGGADLAGAAQAAGFYDQAHFNRDVRAFAGCTPTELLARRLPDGGGLAA
jgi:AraC-like DNA-binding protein